MTVAKRTVERFSVILAKSDKYTYFQVFDRDNIRAYIEIIYMRAAFRVDLLNRSTIWNHEREQDIFTTTTSEKGFEFISRFITFDDKNL